MQTGGVAIGLQAIGSPQVGGSNRLGPCCPSVRSVEGTLSALRHALPIALSHTAPLTHTACFQKSEAQRSCCELLGRETLPGPHPTLKLPESTPCLSMSYSGQNRECPGRGSQHPKASGPQSALGQPGGPRQPRGLRRRDKGSGRGEHSATNQDLEHKMRFPKR